MTRTRWLFVGLVVLGASSAPARGELIFMDDFETGDYCLWSEVSNPCSTEANLESLVDDLDSGLCIPTFTETVDPYTVTVCGNSLCSDGQTVGCQFGISTDNSVINLTSLTGFADISISDGSVGVEVQGFPSCTITVENGTADLDFSMALTPVCGTITEMIGSLPVVDVLNGNTDLSGDGVCALLIVIMQDQLMAMVEEQATEAYRTSLEEALLGRWICGGM